MNSICVKGVSDPDAYLNTRVSTGAKHELSLATQAPPASSADLITKNFPRKESALIDEKLRDRLEQALEDLNKHLRDSGRAISFSIDRDTEQLIVMITNRETSEIVRRIPLKNFAHVPEDADQLKGLLLDELR